MAFTTNNTIPYTPVYKLKYYNKLWKYEKEDRNIHTINIRKNITSFRGMFVFGMSFLASNWPSIEENYEYCGPNNKTRRVL